MNIIEIKNINKNYGENRVLNDVSLKVTKNRGSQRGLPYLKDFSGQ